MLELCSFFATRPVFEKLPMDEGRRSWHQEQVKNAWQMHPVSIRLHRCEAVHPLSQAQLREADAGAVLSVYPLSV